MRTSLEITGGKIFKGDNMAGESKTTTNHSEIRRWVEERGGHPATVKRTGGRDEPGVLRIDFPGYSGEQSLEEITWDEFFEKFDDSNLAFVYQEKTADGKTSIFCKLVSRETAGRKKTSSGGR
jgi:Lipocalin / cytosolic fatty-acid binding protein family